MTTIDNNQSSFIDQKVDQKIENVRIGKVQQVFEHGNADDASNFEIDVTIIGEDIQHRAIPYEHLSADEIHVPKVGDKVMIEYRQGSKTQPIARNIVYTNLDRPPVGKAGMWRKRVPSGDSPAGTGDLYIESYTDYGVDQATTDPRGEDPVESFVRIAKKTDESAESDMNASIEIRDKPEQDSAEVLVELNRVDGVWSSNTWGLKFDLKTGEMKLLDGKGYGIVSDGQGQFTWHHENVNFSEGTTDSL